jgi:hypothetical protein
VIWLLRRVKASKLVFSLFSLAFAFLIIQLIITLVGNVPINVRLGAGPRQSSFAMAGRRR